MGSGPSPNSELEDQIQAQITNHPLLHMSADKRHKVVKGLVHLNFIEMEVIRKTTVTNGFKRIGMVDENKLEKTLSCCYNYQNIPVAQIKIIKDNFNTLVNTFRTHGEIKEEDYDKLGILRSNDKDKDELVVYRQRAVWINNKESISRRTAYLLSLESKEAKKAENKQNKGKKKKEDDPEFKPDKRKRVVNKNGNEKNKKLKLSDNDPPSDSDLDIQDNDEESDKENQPKSSNRLTAKLSKGDKYKHKVVIFKL